MTPVLLVCLGLMCYILAMVDYADRVGPVWARWAYRVLYYSFAIATGAVLGTMLA